MARITGIGGTFFKSPDPAKLAAWYRDVLGLDVQSWGGVMFAGDDPARPHATVWAAFPTDASHFGPSTRDVMINFAVDDLAGMLSVLKAKGVEAHGQVEDENGQFAWIMDPDGTKIELWQPKNETARE
jgi:catechol 2,3-dioxygenase-like lactoylglutathione lyase family enzyme